MDINLSQLLLFDNTDTATGALEFFPEVWLATENLTSPDLLKRRDAIDRLIVLDAPRLSPLVAYLVATRIFDPDLEFRFKVVGVLGKILNPRETGKLAPPVVRLHLKEYCSQMGKRGYIKLLEVAEVYPEAASSIGSLLNLCSLSGEILTKIMSDRKMPFEIRRQAIIFIGRVGFLEAIPALERFESRLEARISGQKSMPFAPPSSPEGSSLLPDVQATLALLREP